MAERIQIKLDLRYSIYRRDLLLTGKIYSNFYLTRLYHYPVSLYEIYPVVKTNLKINELKA